MANGLDKIYPAAHKNTAFEMIEQGGLLTEGCFGTMPDPSRFPQRNRVIAGISDVLIVVEAAEKGGALITAELASGYNRDVFAFPGRVDDKFSAGCNKLIYQNKAAILRSAKDLEFYLNWSLEEETSSKPKQSVLFIDISKEEEPIVAILKQNGRIQIENLCQQVEMPISKLVSHLFNLEMKGAVRTLPGKVYEWLAH
jgi:DNA processing protein